jgi:hypothetical protein
MTYLYQPELETNPSQELLVCKTSDLLMSSEFIPLMTILYHLCSLYDLNRKVEFSCSSVLNLLGWETNQRNRALVEKVLNVLWCSSYFIDTNEKNHKGRLITVMETLKKQDRVYILTINQDFFRYSRSLSFEPINQAFLQSLYLDHKSEFNNQKFPTIMFYQICRFLSEPALKKNPASSSFSFPYKVSKSYRSEKSFYTLFLWMLSKFELKSTTDVERELYLRLKEACIAQNLLKKE